jgi:acyl carrier protein
MNNIQKIESVFIDALLLDEGEFSADMTRDAVDSWDSLGTVSIIVGLQKELGINVDQAEAVQVQSVQGFIDLLEAAGVDISQ